MTHSRQGVRGKADSRGPRFAFPRLVQSGALSVFALALAVEVTSAFVPSEEDFALEIPLPFQQGNLVYGDEVASLTIPPVGVAMSEKIGGRWSVHSWNRQSQSPHYVLGSGADVAPAISSPSQAESAARYVMEQTSMEMNLDPSELRLDGVAEGAGKYAVHFQQTFNGLDVVGGRAHATFLDSGRVFAMGSDFFPIAGFGTVPAIFQPEAETIAIDDLPHEERLVSTEPGEETGLYVLPYPTSIDTFEPRLVWRVTVVTNGRTGVFHTYLDANTGEILWRTNDVHFLDYTGTVDSHIEPTTYCNGEFEQAARYMEVSVNNRGTTNTNQDGIWTVPNADVARPATTRFFGPYVDVNRSSGGSDASQTRTAVPGTALNFVWDDGNSRQDERDIFSGVNFIHDWFETVDPGFAYSNTRINANVGVAGSCNAFYNGFSINFYNAGPGCSGSGCANTGEIQGVVFHEYGHGVQEHLIGFQGNEGIGEGNADILANFLTAESVIGRGFCIGNCSGGIRNSSNDRQYPEDMTGEEHHDGTIMSGVMWDARLNLQASLGMAEGVARAAHIWHFGRVLERPWNQPDQCLSMFVADDDNGNIFDGTPNFDAICQAVFAHDTDGDDFDCPEEGAIWVDFAYVGSEHGTQAFPYNSLFQAHGAAPIDYIMKVKDGASVEVGTLSKRGVIRAIGGVVRIGAP